MTVIEKPVMLPVEMVAMLRGQVGYTEESKAWAQLCILAYRDGRNGVEYETVEEDLGVPGWTTKDMDRILRAAHKQGRVDAGLEQHTSRTAPLYTADVDLGVK